MPTDLNDAFRDFLRNTVNLNPEVAKQARSSREWLLSQVAALPGKVAGFPRLCSDFDIHYGSFARRTKTRDLDDIDQIVGVAARGTTYLDSCGTVTMTVPEGIELRQFCHDGTNRLNSRKVINAFVSALREVPHYRKAEVKRTGEAAVLNLSSHTWAFDLVPGFFTVQESNGRDYYIIPDGNGDWKKTDPRRDRDRADTIVAARGEIVRDAIRLTKYWNKRPTMPGMSSYLIECMAFDHYNSYHATTFPDLEFISLLSHMQSAVHADVYDPKGIQGNINDLSWEDRLKIAQRAREDLQKAARARAAEARGDHKTAIEEWGRVFGSSFPTYG